MLNEKLFSVLGLSSRDNFLKFIDSTFQQTLKALHCTIHIVQFCMCLSTCITLKIACFMFSRPLFTQFNSSCYLFFIFTVIPLLPYIYDFSDLTLPLRCPFSSLSFATVKKLFSEYGALFLTYCQLDEIHIYINTVALLLITGRMLWEAH